MAKTFQCRHTGVLCGAKLKGETEEEVLAKAVEHARAEHGVDISQSSTLTRFAQGLVRDEGAGAQGGR